MAACAALRLLSRRVPSMHRSRPPTHRCLPPAPPRASRRSCWRIATGLCGGGESRGIRALLIHTLDDDARAFYARYDLEVWPSDPLHLVMLLKDLRAALG